MPLGPTLRSLARSPGFTMLAVVTLALGIGAATAIFSVVDAVMLRPLPFPQPDRVVRVWETTPEGGDFTASDPNYLDFRDRNRTFAALAAFKPAPLSLTGSGEPRRLEGIAATHDLFPLLGAEPLIGRGFLPEEDTPGGESRVVVLSHELWSQQFAADPEIVGRTILLDREPHRVTGVMPRDLTFPTADLWIPLAPDPVGSRDDHWLEMVGRLRTGVTVDDAAADLASISREIGADHPVVAGWEARVEPFAEWMVGPRFRSTMLLLLGGVACLLLIGCLNLANLLLARSTVRQTEIAIRAALGAGRGRIVRQLLTESLVLAAIGTAVGLVAAMWVIDLVRIQAPEGIPRLAEISIDGRVVAFAAGLGFLTSLLFGLTPAVRASRVELAGTLRSARSGAAGQRRMRDALVVSQIALATVLLVAAGLMMRSFLRLQAEDPGFQAQQVLVVPLQLDATAYAEEWRRVTVIDEILARIEAIPGVRSAGASAVDPLSGWNLSNDVTPFERAAEAGESGFLQAGWRAVTPGFFRSMGIPLLRGRTFTSSDSWDGPPLAVISATLADQLWPGEEAVGRRLYWGGIDDDPWTVIGVVDDYRDVEVGGEPQPVLFLPNNKIAWPSMTLLVQTEGQESAVAAAIRDEIRVADPLLPAPEIRTLERSLARAVAAPRFRSLLLGAFAAIALLLAGVGVYGVTAFTVARRTREFGVRLALGASPNQISGMVLRGGLAVAVVGLLLGTVGAWALARLLDSLLYEVSAGDPATFLAVVLLLGGMTLLASYLPGRRAGRADPVAALRED